MKMNCIDTHAHVFSKLEACIETARYTPDYDATVQQFIGYLDEYQIRYGVLVQPSFLGTDNQVMLDAIQQYPDRLKGIAVVDLDIPLSKLRKLKDQRIVGARLNLFGRDVPNLETAEWKTFLSHLETLAWQIELHAPPAYLVAILPVLNQYNLNIVIDHFGRTDPVKGITDPDYKTFLTLLDVHKHWIKTSGFYRLGEMPINIDIAQQAFNLLKEKGFLDKMIWGSDWPHTQNESKLSYQCAFETFKKIVTDPNEQSMILSKNALKLFQF